MADKKWQDRHQPSDLVIATRKAAVAFANDYGPLPAANRGDADAAHTIAQNLVDQLRRQGLRITRI